jgi:hypothetical protein
MVDRSTTNSTVPVHGTDDPEGDAFFARYPDVSWDELSRPTLDENLTSASCIGSGVTFPELWEVIKRYILHGDEFFASGGLRALTACVWQMPLKEATDAIEHYFRQHHYDVPVGGRGGVNLYAVQAAYAVATTFGWESEEETVERQGRLVQVLRFYRYRLSQIHPTDVQVVDDAIEAILNNKRDYQAEFPDVIPDESNMANEEDISPQGNVAADTITQPTQVDTSPLDEQDVRHMIDNVLQQRNTEQQENLSLTQTEAMGVRHGYEMLDIKFSTHIASLDRQLDGIEKTIDRYLGGQQIKTGNKQVSAAWWGVAVAVLLGIVSIVVALVF